MNSETDANTIGKRISMLRREKGFTQEQLAEKLNISPQAVSKWENDISSPDISLIPKLAYVLGVTTDELLGVTPIKPHVVVVDTSGSNHDKATDQHMEFRFRGGKGSKIVFGVFLLAIGALFLLREFGAIPLFAGVSFWSIAWPVLLVGLGVSMLKEAWYPVSIGCILVGLYKLVYLFDVIPNLPQLTWGMVWPLALLLIGLSVITSGALHKKSHKQFSDCSGVNVNGKQKAHLSETEEEGVVMMECDFAEAKHVFAGEEFKHAQIESNFGTVTLDLRQCKKFAADASVNADVNFGSLSVLLPPTVMLQKQVDNTFAACTVKGAPDSNVLYSIAVRGSVNFGSIEIRY